MFPFSDRIKKTKQLFSFSDSEDMNDPSGVQDEFLNIGNFDTYFIVFTYKTAADFNINESGRLFN